MGLTSINLPKISGNMPPPTTDISNIAEPVFVCVPNSLMDNPQMVPHSTAAPNPVKIKKYMETIPVLT